MKDNQKTDSLAIDALPFKSSKSDNPDPVLPKDSLSIRGKWFADSQNRICMLRGVNLSGNCKNPATPDLPSHEAREFYSGHRYVSFVGRPFPLGEADEHFLRLKSWGFGFLRFQITWEAIEHEGPGIVDEKYLDYVAEILRKAKLYGFKCFVDPHQDVWSRFTGGSGAPGWTLELVGFDLAKLVETEAALVHNVYPDPENFPRMIWPTNYFKLGCATMFTLFFGGKMFAPRSLVDLRTNTMKTYSPAGFQSLYNEPDFSQNYMNIQDFLQRHYFDSIKALIQRLRREEVLLDSVVCGYDTLNEPSGGYLGWENLEKFSIHQELKNGCTPTPLQSMLLGEGVSCEVEQWKFTWSGPRFDTKKPCNSNHIRCWRDGYSCIWKEYGLYCKDKKIALKPLYFAVHPETKEPVDWAYQFWKPFVRKFTDEIRSAHAHAIIFVEPPVNEAPPLWDPENDPTYRICYAPHWYDGITLINKHFTSLFTLDYIGYKRGKYLSLLSALSFGYNGIKRNFAKQLGTIRKEGVAYIGETPCLIGEIGIPFDMDRKRSFTTNGKYKSQLKAMNANMTALDMNLLNFTIWNYCPGNTHKWGDGWNGEDLSIWTPDTSDVGLDGTDALFHSTVLEVQNRSDSGICSSTEGLELEVGTTLTDTLGSSHRQRYKTAPEALVHERTQIPLGQLAQGARAFAAFLRPYPVKTFGTPISLSFDFDKEDKPFRFVFENSTECATGKCFTEIFLPFLHYGLPLATSIGDNAKSCSYFNVECSDGRWEYDPNSQILSFYHSNKSLPTFNGHHEIVVTVASKASVNDLLAGPVKQTKSTKLCSIL